METCNISTFIIIGFSDLPDFEVSIFIFFLLFYIVALLANIFLISVICVSPRMKSPMYLFLSNLSGVDILCLSSISPKLLYIFIADEYRILFSECITQFFFSTAFSTAEYLILTVMSYDRYVAVCKLLYYTQTLSIELCVMLCLGVWLMAFVMVLAITVCFSCRNFCFSDVIDNFFCDLISLLELSCRSTSIIQAIIFAEAFVFNICFLLTVASYILIIISVQKIQSLQGMYKAFSTCASHLTAVTLFYSVLFSLYLMPQEAITQKQRKLMSVLYTNVIPMLNPFIYSLRNKDVMKAVQNIVRHVHTRWLLK